MVEIWSLDLPTWRGGRVVDGSGLENQRGASLRGFESHPLRFPDTPPRRGFCVEVCVVSLVGLCSASRSSSHPFLTGATRVSLGARFKGTPIQHHVNRHLTHRAKGDPGVQRHTPGRMAPGMPYLSRFDTRLSSEEMGLNHAKTSEVGSLSSGRAAFSYVMHSGGGQPS